MWRHAIALVWFAAVLAGQTPAADPFVFFRPSVVVTGDERRQLDRGDAVTRTLAGTGRSVGVFAAVRVDVDGDRLVAWTRDIVALKKSAYVLSIGRFSDPPRIEDLEGLSLDEEDLSAIRRCRRGACDLKLSGAEMDRLHKAIEVAGDGWQEALQHDFRALVLMRVQGYLAKGHAALQGYEDKGEPVSPGARFSSLLSQLPFLGDHLPTFAEYLEQYPDRPIADIESFVYWSKERLGGKPTVTATHVSILRGAHGVAPDALVAGKGIFSTHYLNAALGLTAVVRGEAGSPNYLVHVNRSDVDLVGGLFGRVVRAVVERRIRNEAADTLQGLRRRLESGNPN